MQFLVFSTAELARLLTSYYALAPEYGARGLKELSLYNKIMNIL